MAISSARKITKSGKSKGPTKSDLSAAAVERIENELCTTTQSASGSKPEKKARIVIDGKTYTCVICKNGHRVGVCKHASERPMKATHPPGRPAAGATKKVVCKCPTNCACPPGCKCERDCTCIQTMYMLVYIPGPAAEGVNNASSNDDNGTWKVDREVLTDLNGTILSEEEVQRRREKESLKDSQISPQSNNTLNKDSHTNTSGINARSGRPSAQNCESPLKAIPKATGGCCNHQEAVRDDLKRGSEATADLIDQSSNTFPRCNCGTACLCAFCPEHSNNATSHNAIRQQVNLYQQSNSFPIDTGDILFDAAVAPGMSCMGGQPRFAFSRNAEEFNLANFSQTFPSGRGGGAYMIAYPMHPKYALTMQDLAADFERAYTMGIPNELTGSEQMQPMSIMPSTNDVQMFDYDIGEALVANDGPNGWQQSTHFNWGQPDLEIIEEINYAGSHEYLSPKPEGENLISLPTWDSIVDDGIARANEGGVMLSQNGTLTQFGY